MTVTANPQGSLIEGLAPELLEWILCFLPPRDLTSFGRTCRRANAFVKPSNQILWRSSFLQVFDDPRDAWKLLLPTARSENRQRESTWDWYREVRRRFEAFGAVCEIDGPAVLVNTEQTIRTLLDIRETASYHYQVISSDNDDGLYPDRVSLNINFLERLFSGWVVPNPEKFVHDYHRDIDGASLPLDLMTDPGRRVTRSMLGSTNSIPEWASRFHIFYGMTKREKDSVKAKASARAIVYDWNVTGPSAEYGPLRKDDSGIIDWQTLEAITSLMHRIIAALRKEHQLTNPTGFSHSIPHVLPLLPRDQEDWAGVTNGWIGTYAFLDYRALVHYNFANNLEHHIDLGLCEEACGDLMVLGLELDVSKELQHDNRLRMELPYCKDLPILYFNGYSNRGTTVRPSILVRGCVCLLPEGREVRWRFIIR